MGCNTSKESSVTHADEKGDIRIASDDNGADLKGDSSYNQEKILKLPLLKNKNGNSEKPSAKDSTTSESAKPEAKATIKDQEENVQGLEEAATKIQAAFRGHKTRKSMKQGDKPEKTNNDKGQEATEDLASEFKPDDPELCNAATKIQASFRGHMARKKINGKEGDEQEKEEENAAKKSEPEEDFDMDLADPELNKAATKIQTTFRTHLKHKDE